MGTPAFMEFVESVQSEGVELEHVPMGGGARREDSLVVEVETGNPDKNVEALDIALPRLARRYQREYKNLDALDALTLRVERLPLKPFTPEQTREIVFKTMLDGEAHHTVALIGAGIGDGRSVIAFFARQLLNKLRLVGGYEVLYGQVKAFVRERLFDGVPVDMDDPVVLRNLSESAAAKRVFDTFKAAINALTRTTARRASKTSFACATCGPSAPSTAKGCRRNVHSSTASSANRTRAASSCASRRFWTAPRAWPHSPRTISRRASSSTMSRPTATCRLHAQLHRQGRRRQHHHHRRDQGPRRARPAAQDARLAQWCDDATAASRAQGGPEYRFVYVDQEGFDRYPPGSLADLATMFREFQSET